MVYLSNGIASLKGDNNRAELARLFSHKGLVYSYGNACHSWDPIIPNEIYPNFQSTERSVILVYDSFDQMASTTSKIDSVLPELLSTMPVTNAA